MFPLFVFGQHVTIISYDFRTVDYESGTTVTDNSKWTIDVDYTNETVVIKNTQFTLNTLYMKSVLDEGTTILLTDKVNNSYRINFVGNYMSVYSDVGELKFRVDHLFE